ncbi:MAG TPA: TRAP transporter substrate-binding protein [Xanthobacteraceae bacterium]|jgi:TRAP-type C4-dicarboxylate transport system substrate-binding protein|nr:TRAP transporter substrate-binding protein [Xanthobacteraceae bacterium]
MTLTSAIRAGSRGCRGTRSAAIAFAAALAWCAPSLPATAADFVMKFGTATINETQHQFIKFYKEELEKASGGRIEVQIYPASQLGPIPREIEGVQLGNIQGYIGPVDFFVGVDPRFGVFSAPMLFRDESNAAATIHDPAVQKAMFDLAAPKRMVGIATLDLGSSNYGAKNAIMRLADFNGKKLRINGTELERQKMAKLGATGIGMPLSEVVPALDQGTIDGTISGLSVFVAFKMNDLLKVVTVTNDTFIISIAVVSKPWLDTLPADLQKAVTEAGAAVQAKAQAWEVDFTKKLASDWTALGGTVHALPTEDLARMKTLLDPVADETTKGQPAVHDMLELVRAAAVRH